MGTAALNGPVLQGLRDRNAGLISDKRALEGDVRGLQADVETADDLVRALSDELIGGRLDEQRVLLVLAPGADSRLADQLTTAVSEAGGAVTGRLLLQPELLDPASTQLIEDLVASVLPAGVDLPEDSTLARAGAVLGASLLQRSSGSSVERDAAQQVVSGFSEAGLVELAGAAEPPASATAAVLLAAPAPAEPTDDVPVVLDALLSLAAELRERSGGVVVAGPADSAVEGGLVRALRSDTARDAALSSVDNADRAVGQVAVVLALREQLRGGVGRYGGGQGAAAPVPTGSGGSSPAAEPEPAPAPEPEPAPQPEPG